MGDECSISLSFTRIKRRHFWLSRIRHTSLASPCYTFDVRHSGLAQVRRPIGPPHLSRLSKLDEILPRLSLTPDTREDPTASRINYNYNNNFPRRVRMRIVCPLNPVVTPPDHDPTDHHSEYRGRETSPLTTFLYLRVCDESSWPFFQFKFNTHNEKQIIKDGLKKLFKSNSSDQPEFVVRN